MNLVNRLVTTSVSMTTSVVVDRVEEAVEIVFQYINMLKQNEPNERIFNEIRDISNMDFAFRGLL